MILFSTALTKHQLTFTPLSNCMAHLTLAATWTEDAWGYIRNRGVECRKEILKDLSEQLYIGTLHGQPVAMFALFDHKFHPDLIAGSRRLLHVRELMYVYVDKDYRGLGFGRQIIDEAKRLAREAGADLILLDTLKPNLNRMYEKQGAVGVCEGRLFSHPTEVMQMSL